MTSAPLPPPEPVTPWTTRFSPHIPAHLFGNAQPSGAFKFDRLNIADEDGLVDSDNTGEGIGVEVDVRHVKGFVGEGLEVRIEVWQHSEDNEVGGIIRVVGVGVGVVDLGWTVWSLVLRTSNGVTGYVSFFIPINLH
jgi:hypothetical protein